MSLHELHPEELIDKAERGALEASERKQLDRHLAACAVCRFEVSARDDFRAQDRMNEAMFSDDAIDMMVGASLRGANAHDTIKANLPSISSRPRALHAGRRWGVLLAVAALLVSAQATARWLGIRPSSWLSPPTMTTVTTNAAPADDAVPAVNGRAATSQMKPSTPASIPEVPEMRRPIRSRLRWHRMSRDQSRRRRRIRMLPPARSSRRPTRIASKASMSSRRASIASCSRIIRTHRKPSSRARRSAACCSTTATRWRRFRSSMRI